MSTPALSLAPTSPFTATTDAAPSSPDQGARAGFDPHVRRRVQVHARVAGMCALGEWEALVEPQ